MSRSVMAKAIGRGSAPSTKKKPRHTVAQKKAAAQLRAQFARKGAKSRSSADFTERPARPERTTYERPERKSFDRPERGERKSFERPERGGSDRSRGNDRGGPRAFRSDRRDDRTEWASRRSADRAPVHHHDEAEEALATETARLEASRASRAAATGTPTGENGFAALGVQSSLVHQLSAQGITTPFPIQTVTIPDALAGRDVLGRGQTGSGKTLAFGLPMMQRLAEGDRARPHQPRAVVMTPTRELAMQIVEALRPLFSAVGLRHQLVAGGMSYTPQLRALEQGVDVIVATPGRMNDLIERGAADLSQVEITVLDEADHMSEMGFLEAITAILDLIPSGGQRLLFSATLDHGIGRIASDYLTDPVTHSTNDVAASVDTMEHHVFLVHPHEKRTVIAAVANREGRTLIFARTKLGADRVAEQLRESGVLAAALHGGLNQAARTRVLGAFKSGALPVLVATDVAARGIHVDDVTLVLQIDPPADHKDYLHRSGRTARAGDRGVVVTLALPHQRRTVIRLLQSAGVDTAPQNVTPEDHAVIHTAGGRMPSGESISQARLDALLRPSPRQRPGGPGRGRRSAGPRQSRRPQHSGGRRREW
ncbi:MAG: DEAD/DEAH box helicase [Actinomycetota bacterium]|nr:DEAD/DEAH box helicase [Actinomycetota bacterium]